MLNTELHLRAIERKYYRFDRASKVGVRNPVEIGSLCPLEFVEGPVNAKLQIEGLHFVMYI